MATQLTLALAQVNPTVGDVAGNLELVRRTRDAARAADLVVFPELVIIGYPPEDLVLRPAVVDATRAAIEQLAAESRRGGPALLVGTPWRDGDLFNAVVLIDRGQVTVRCKRELPNYGVFDEKRVFTAGPLPQPVDFRGVRLGIPVCEDIWYPHVVEHLVAEGAELLIVPNGSPYEVDKFSTRTDLARRRVEESGLPLVYVNQVGGQDELVFDGGSFVMNAGGDLPLVLSQWTEALVSTRWEKAPSKPWTCEPGERVDVPHRSEGMYRALMTGLRDYVNKNRFPGVVLGLSGGIDSAVTAAVAADALGPDRVLGVRLPSRYTSDLSQDDATRMAAAAGIRLETLPIIDPVGSLEATLAEVFAGRSADVTEENLQARVRGVLLMALSNKFGLMLLTTGNKSEMSVGYATLYGDMCGGYSVLKDVYKTDVYRLARWRNRNRPHDALAPSGIVIPESTIERAPTAELRPNQTDQDTLPPYEELDAILQALVEEERSVEAIAADGYDVAVVQRVQRMLFGAEYKRRQAPPGVKITRRSFGRDRRYPITNGFRDLLPANSVS